MNYSHVASALPASDTFSTRVPPIFRPVDFIKLIKKRFPTRSRIDRSSIRAPSNSSACLVTYCKTSGLRPAQRPIDTHTHTNTHHPNTHLPNYCSIPTSRSRNKRKLFASICPTTDPSSLRTRRKKNRPPFLLVPPLIICIILNSWAAKRFPPIQVGAKRAITLIDVGVYSIQWISIVYFPGIIFQVPLDWNRLAVNFANIVSSSLPKDNCNNRPTLVFSYLSFPFARPTFFIKTLSLQSCSLFFPTISVLFLEFLFQSFFLFFWIVRVGAAGFRLFHKFIMRLEFSGECNRIVGWDLRLCKEFPRHLVRCWSGNLRKRRDVDGRDNIKEVLGE